MHKHLHIVCFDVPYPVDYGGVFDLFYKIKALHECGIRIHLHCFEYGRGIQDELRQYCETLTYYKRRGFLKGFSLQLPFIVSSRSNPILLNNLLKDDYPVLLEGIHSTYFLHAGKLQSKKVFVRLHNVEFEYYAELAKTEKNFFKKLYFQHESSLLKKYEKEIAGKAIFIAVSEKDKQTYQEIFLANDVKYLPVFLPFTDVKSEEGSGTFCLYHGNLSVPENEKAVVWLLDIFKTMDIPFVVAGKKPSKHLKTIMNDNTCIVVNPSEVEINELIMKAHIHILPSFNKTGIKIKLLNALFNGRFVVTNQNAVEENSLDSLCNIAVSTSDYKKIIEELFNQPFKEKYIAERKKKLECVYNNIANAHQLMQWIW